MASLITVVQILESHAREQVNLDVERDMRIAWDQLRRLGNNFYVKNGVLHLENHSLSGRLDIVDKITELVGGTATIFSGDLRVVTSIHLTNGKRATGTRLAQNEAYTSIFQNKEPFRGFVDILGVNYFTAYDPILDSEENVIGILYVGRETESYFSPITEVKLSIALIVLISAILGAFLTFLSNRIIISKAHIDSLTRVLNRKVGEEFLQEALARTFDDRNKLSIAFIDLDNFKSVNDKFGHVVGDEVLKSIAKALKRIGRHSDHIVRWGGDEFLMIFEGASKDEAYEILKRVVEEHSILPKLPDDSIQTLSIGLAGVDRHDEPVDIAQLITAADYMMYQSKNGGRNQISM